MYSQINHTQQNIIAELVIKKLFSCITK